MVVEHPWSLPKAPVRAVDDATSRPVGIGHQWVSAESAVLVRRLASRPSLRPGVDERPIRQQSRCLQPESLTCLSGKPCRVRRGCPSRSPRTRSYSRQLSSFHTNDRRCSDTRARHYSPRPYSGVRQSEAAMPYPLAPSWARVQWWARRVRRALQRRHDASRFPASREAEPWCRHDTRPCRRDGVSSLRAPASGLEWLASAVQVCLARPPPLCCQSKSSLRRGASTRPLRLLRGNRTHRHTRLCYRQEPVGQMNLMRKAGMLQRELARELGISWLQLQKIPEPHAPVACKIRRGWARLGFVCTRSEGCRNLGGPVYDIKKGQLQHDMSARPAPDTHAAYLVGAGIGSVAGAAIAFAM